MPNQTSAPHHRRSIRLKDYDYSSEGSYFITIVTFQRNPILGMITDYEMQLTPAGKIVRDIWNTLPTRYPQFELDEFVVMPNHFHAILNILGAVHEPPLPKSRRHMLLSLIVGYFKMNTAKQINLLLDTPGNPVWQRNYYEHIITTEREYNQIAEYIFTNPQNWQTDSENC